MMTVQRLVLVVDDDDSVRYSLKRLLRSVGYDVRTFTNAEQVMVHGRPHETCCMVLDVRMPGVNGLDCHRALATRSIRIPTIFLTGHGDVPTSVAAMKAGASDFLSKPCEPRELLAAVERALDFDARSLAANKHLAELRLLSRTLTPRENEVFNGVVAGMLNKQIAHDLGITEKTVKIHRGRVMEKMRVGSLADLVRAAAALEKDRQFDASHFGDLTRVGFAQLA